MNVLWEGKRMKWLYKLRIPSIYINAWLLPTFTSSRGIHILSAALDIICWEWRHTYWGSSPLPGHRHRGGPSRWRWASAWSRTLCWPSDWWQDRSPLSPQKFLKIIKKIFAHTTSFIDFIIMDKCNYTVPNIHILICIYKIQAWAPSSRACLHCEHWADKLFQTLLPAPIGGLDWGIWRTRRDFRSLIVLTDYVSHILWWQSDIENMKCWCMHVCCSFWKI